MNNKIIQMMMELNTDNVFTLISESYKNGIITSLKDFDKINNNRYICKVKKGNGNYYKIIIFENEGKLDIDILDSNKDYELVLSNIIKSYFRSKLNIYFDGKYLLSELTNQEINNLINTITLKNLNEYKDNDIMLSDDKKMRIYIEKESIELYNIYITIL